MNNPIANILSGLLGGLIVLVLGAILISTDVIDTGDSSTVVQRQAPMTQPTSDDGEGGGPSATSTPPRAAALPSYRPRA
jgi:hypothetical protein